MPAPSDPGRRPGRRRAERTGASRRFRWLPSPALAGAAAVVVAAAGAMLVSSGTTGSSAGASAVLGSPALTGSSMSAPATGPGTDAVVDPVAGRTDSVAGGGAVLDRTPAGLLASRTDETEVSRSGDRIPLQQEAELEARQRMQALTALAGKVQARADELRSRQWVLPVSGYSITATFGESSYLWSTTHTGLDFAAPEGTPIVAVAAGTVSSIAYDDAYGNKTEITLDDGTEIWYCHQGAQYVAEGDTVTAGERIGTVGSTGNTTGPHLHLEVRPHRNPVDPFAALVEHGVRP